MTRTLAVGGVTALALSAAACSVTTSGAQCKVDDNCQTGQYCAASSGQVGTCLECSCAAGLTCSGGPGLQPQCLCPVNTPSSSVWTFYVDANAGSVPTLGTGVETPPQCRFSSIDAALSAAKAIGAGDTAIVMAVGSSQPGGMNFLEAGPLAIGPGVSLASSSPTADFYVITAPAATATAPFITVSAGAALSGFEIQSSGEFQSGNAIQSDCTTGGTVSIKNVNVAGAGIGRGGFQTGVYHSGACNLDLESSTISGVNDSAVVLSTTSESSVTLLDNVFASNGATTQYALSQRGGGLVLNEQAPATLEVHGNRLYGNSGDQVLVALSSPSVTVSLAGGSDASACGTTSNLIACYDTGFVGIFSNALSLVAVYNQWDVDSPSAPTDYFGAVDANPACPAENTVTCP